MDDDEVVGCPTHGTGPVRVAWTDLGGKVDEPAANRGERQKFFICTECGWNNFVVTLGH